ncbi:LAMI_0C04412g1_1 [Lachancea mirantina]|uniref:LAMI_0C04412g1_1 n=1 Tax=Lachancea mirantina TaxID=1230905 RepID=A0A1G4J2D1_9SACH|nr:LAMI_0C04412g1_1 [Lachancea mirantina]
MTSSESSRAVHRARFVNYNGSNITALGFSHTSNCEKRAPNDLRLAVGRSNGDIELWNPRNGWFQELKFPGGKDRTIEGLVWCNVEGEPLRLFSIGGSTALTEWNLETGLPLKNYDCNSGVIWSMAINSSQDRLAVGCDNGSVVLVDISGGKGSMEHDFILQRHNSRVLSVAWQYDHAVIGGCADGRIRTWNAERDAPTKGRLLNTMKVDKSKKESTLVWVVIYLPKINQIVSGDSTGAIKFWDCHFATLVQSFKVHDADVLCLSTDENNSKLFSAGVDRKIYEFTSNVPTGPKSLSKWIVTCNRLLHAGDVRTMTSFQAKNAQLLVSGGTEKALVVSPLDSFSDGIYTKIPFQVPFQKNILINKEQRLCVMWEQSVIKIWAIGIDQLEAKNYKLVCKLSLKDEQHIATCALSPDGQVLVVGRLSSTKVFHLQPQASKVKVTKLDNDFLLKTGCKHVRFIDNSKLIFVSANDEILFLDLEDDENDEKPRLIGMPDDSDFSIATRLDWMNTIDHIDAFENRAVISRPSGSIQVIDIEEGSVRTLARLPNAVTALQLSKRDTVLLTTSDNKLLEFNVNPEHEDSVLSQWCKTNKDRLPKDFENLKNKWLGVFCDGDNENRVWLWGVNLLMNLDLSQNLPVSSRRKPEKRSRDGGSVTKASTDIGDEDDDEDDEANILNEFALSSKQVTERKPVGTDKSYFLTDKYRPILFADVLSHNELVVIERPASMTTADVAAFDLPKLRF